MIGRRPVGSAPSLLRETSTSVDQRRRFRSACTSKILDIFESTQQIQQLIVARRLLGKTSAELK
ncbi:hypothetical protein BWI15_13680 [Kribbella sp. ALI-6-A]|nr:hypothetical protein BWI15_13680 [Kribbella sp. ALI-6-A]